MPSTAAARRYAAALFSIAQEDGRTLEIRDELLGFSRLLAANAELNDTVLTPLHSVAERKAVIRAVASEGQLSASVRNFMSFLVDRRRLIDFATISDEFSRLVDVASGITTAEVVTASPLDDRRKDRLRRALSDRTGREVKLEASVDPSLLGGAIAKVGDLVFDGSLRTQLAQLRANLMKES